MMRQDSLFLTSETNDTIDSSENYVYDGSDIVMVFDGSNNLTDRYLHDPLVDQVFAAEDSAGNVLWALSDNQGTVRDVVDYDSGTDTTSVSNHIKYDAFGNITAESDSSVEFLYSYTGRVYDEDAELYYYRARWYDPLIGRFIGEDPLGFAASDVNLSRYVGNSTPNFTDPSGMIEVFTGESSFENTDTPEIVTGYDEENGIHYAAMIIEAPTKEENELWEEMNQLGLHTATLISEAPGEIDDSTPIEDVFDENTSSGNIMGRIFIWPAEVVGLDDEVAGWSDTTVWAIGLSPIVIVPGIIYGIPAAGAYVGSTSFSVPTLTYGRGATLGVRVL